MFRVGLGFFVWLPFPGTGACVGALIGLVMGVPIGRLVTLLLGTMWVGVVSWTFGIDLFLTFTGTTGRIIAWGVTALLMLFAATTRWRR